MNDTKMVSLVKEDLRVELRLKWLTHSARDRVEILQLALVRQKPVFNLQRREFTCLSVSCLLICLYSCLFLQSLNSDQKQSLNFFFLDACCFDIWCLILLARKIPWHIDAHRNRELQTKRERGMERRKA